MSSTIKRALPFLFVIITALTSQTVTAKPVKIIGEQASNTVSINDIEHSDFNTLLNQYVDVNGNVDYKTWQKNDFETLKTYLESLSQADPEKEASQAHILSYWINAYNALTIYGILEKYPTSSIKNHTAKLFGYNIWKDLKLQVADNAYSLDSIEHEILRKMNEPRIHFAIVCASESCPRLIAEAYVAETLEEQLITNAEHFFAQDGNFQINEKNGRVRLSSILNWFGEDFGDSKSEVLDSIKDYLSDEDIDIVDSRDSWKISYLPYSWKLNRQ